MGKSDKIYRKMTKIETEISSDKSDSLPALKRHKS